MVRDRPETPHSGIENSSNRLDRAVASGQRRRADVSLIASTCVPHSHTNHARDATERFRHSQRTLCGERRDRPQRILTDPPGLHYVLATGRHRFAP
jgi:hypothetical protein